MKLIFSFLVAFLLFVFSSQAHTRDKLDKVSIDNVLCDYTVHEFSISYGYSNGKTTVTVSYDIEVTGCGRLNGRYRGVNSWEKSTSTNGNSILVGDPLVISGPSVGSNPELHNIVKAETLARM